VLFFFSNFCIFSQMADGDQQEAVLFYARALYSYQPETDTEIGFEESGILLLFSSSCLFFLQGKQCAEVVSVIEDYGDGWWRAYGANTAGKVPANYFEVLPNTEEQPADESGYSYEYAAEGYEYGGGATGEAGESAETQPPLATTSAQSTQPSQPAAQSTPPAQPQISSSPAYAEQMKCWGDILETQKQEKQKLERQIADSELSLTNLRKEAFYFKQLDFILQEVLKLETEMDLDLDASVQFQRVQLALSRVQSFSFPFSDLPLLPITTTGGGGALRSTRVNKREPERKSHFYAKSTL
jgi:hypothetical protein